MLMFFLLIRCLFLLILFYQQTAFMVYSTYCNSYPRALVELDIYAGNIEAITLLEK